MLHLVCGGGSQHHALQTRRVVNFCEQFSVLGHCWLGTHSLVVVVGSSRR